MTDTMDEDLMDAMNAALEDDSVNENPSLSGNSLQSVDVMDEAMNLLLSGSGEIDVNDDIGEDDTVEEIDFDNFLKSPSEQTKNAENKRDDSPTSATTGETEESAQGTPKANNQNKETENNIEDIKPDNVINNNSNKFGITDEGRREEPQVVPLAQFLNAMALIQDLENRIQVLETDRQCLLEEKEQLQETCNNQATVVAEMEAKLEQFPKLLEQTVQEEATLAASQAEAETKNSFWRKDMARQEQEYKEEQRRKSRTGKHAETTDSLKQADFLRDVVERKEQTNPVEALKRPSGILRAFRGLGNRITFHNGNRPNEVDASKKDDPTSTKEAPSKELKDFGDDEDVMNESKSRFDDNIKDSKALDLMT